MATYINEGEITLVLRECVPWRRQISAISGVHVRAGAVQAGAPWLFGEVMVLRQGGRLCLRGQRGCVAARGLLPPRPRLMVQGRRFSHKAANWSKWNLLRLQGKHRPARPGWITRDQQGLNKSGTESLSTSSTVRIPSTGKTLTPWIHSVLGIGMYLGCIPPSLRIFSFRNAGAEESWAPDGSLRQGSMGKASPASGRRAAAPAPRCWDAPSVFLEFLPWPRPTGMSCRVRTESWTEFCLPLLQRLEYSLK